MKIRAMKHRMLKRDHSLLLSLYPSSFFALYRAEKLMKIGRKIDCSSIDSRNLNKCYSAPIIRTRE